MTVQRKQKPPIPTLLDAVRVTLPLVARWIGDVDAAAVAGWRQGTYQPLPARRARLVQAVRRHAAELLKLAEAVEREGATSAAQHRARPGSGGRRGVRATVHRSATRGGGAR